MDKKELEQKLENMNKPQLETVKPNWQLKLAIMNARKSAWTGVLLMLVPAIVLSGGFLDSIFHILLPPWSWIKEYGTSWPVWARIAVFSTTVMICPLIAVLLNVLAIVWIEYDREKKILNISIRMRTFNLVIIIIAGLLAALFIGHAIADWIAGAD